MNNAKRLRIGCCLCFVLSGSFVTIANVAEASDTVYAELRCCAMLEGSAERLSCFDRTLDRGAETRIPVSPDGAGAEASALDEFLRCAFVANVNRRLHCYDQILIPAAASSAETPGREAIRTPPPTPSADETYADEPHTKSAEPQAAVAFGLNTENTEPGAIDVRVVGLDRNIVDKLVFRTDDGQVWVQTDKAKARYASPPFQARIRQASMGSYFLQPVDGGVSVRVKRSQ